MKVSLLGKWPLWAAAGLVGVAAGLALCQAHTGCFLLGPAATTGHGEEGMFVKHPQTSVQHVARPTSERLCWSQASLFWSISTPVVGPCQRLASVLEELAAENPAAKIVKVDVDSNPALAAHYGVDSIPNLKVFERGGHRRTRGTGEQEPTKGDVEPMSVAMGTVRFGHHAKHGRSENGTVPFVGGTALPHTKDETGPRHDLQRPHGSVERVSGWPDAVGTLSGAGTGHLVDCHPCQIVIDNIRQTIVLYRNGQALPLPDGLHERLRAIMGERWGKSRRAGRWRASAILARKPCRA